MFLKKFALDYQSPLIFDDSFDFPDPEESKFVEAIADGPWAKSGGLLPMSAYEKESQASLFGEWLSSHFVLGFCYPRMRTLTDSF